MRTLRTVLWIAAGLLIPSVAVAQTALDKLVAAAKSENELNFTSFAAAFGGIWTLLAN